MVAEVGGESVAGKSAVAIEEVYAGIVVSPPGTVAGKSAIGTGSDGVRTAASTLDASGFPVVESPRLPSSLSDVAAGCAG